MVMIDEGLEYPYNPKVADLNPASATEHPIPRLVKTGQGF
ncbi:hypothetical protein ATORI0001_1397 [Lancefieldella rimae ATCC 49626]|uniref:Uncharacterized protein n=1 Tax=Lancefieldella rimae (strain ATCC 49626 / DSM 7090 / CCUG 31168 / NBRC 15546 / VPI D140H-11A) TaxID=553184 RepID=B9CM58_LANR4|nr:hypothetical protein ATORI0001_1397 [Lancefieldella rimae ATCC 49626]